MFSYCVHPKRRLNNVEVHVEVLNGLLGLEREKILTIDLFVSSYSRFHSLLSYGDTPKRLPCPFLLGCAIGF